MHRLLDVDPAAASPIWRQIEDGMRRLVASGRLVSGIPVPSVRELAKSLRVNPATVSKAYRQLTEGGLLEVRRGEGTYVVGLSPEALGALRRGLLAGSAAAFVREAGAVGADREEALRAVEDSWQHDGEGGRGGLDG
jgi:GntR family transcriptional regulator